MGDGLTDEKLTELLGRWGAARLQLTDENALRLADEVIQRLADEVERLRRRAAEDEKHLALYDGYRRCTCCGYEGRVTYVNRCAACKEHCDQPYAPAIFQQHGEAWKSALEVTGR